VINPQRVNERVGIREISSAPLCASAGAETSAAIRAGEERGKKLCFVPLTIDSERVNECERLE